MEQDWEPVVVGRRSKTGPKIIVPKISETANVARKLNDTEIGKPKTLTPESRNLLVQTRVALGKNQVQLNQDCRFPVNTIREIESGRLCPSQQQVQVLNRVLKVVLKYAS